MSSREGNEDGGTYYTPPPRAYDDPRFTDVSMKLPEPAVMKTPPLHERIERGRKEREAQPLVTQQKEATYTWDIFYKGKEGYAEHIQVGFEDTKQLQEARQGIVMWLGAIEAETLPRDKDNPKGGYAPRAAAPRQQTPQAQPGVQPVCPIDGAPMEFRQGGISGPQSRNPGAPYPAFWSCSNYKATGCRGRMNA